MQIYTPGGLTIKLHADRVERVLKPARHLINIEDAFVDIQLWANFPGNMLSILAIITALTTQSWTSVLIVGVLGFVLVDLYQQFFYSRFLKVLFPFVLGAFYVTLPASLITIYILYQEGAIIAGITQFVMVLMDITGIADLILFFSTPIRFSVRCLFGKRAKEGAIETAFIKILNHKARQVGVILDWQSYNRRETDTSFFFGDHVR